MLNRTPNQNQEPNVQDILESWKNRLHTYARQFQPSPAVQQQIEPAVRIIHENQLRSSEIFFLTAIDYFNLLRFVLTFMTVAAIPFAFSDSDNETTLLPDVGENVYKSINAANSLILSILVMYNAWKVYGDKEREAYRTSHEEENDNTSPRNR